MLPFSLLIDTGHSEPYMRPLAMQTNIRRVQQYYEYCAMPWRDFSDPHTLKAALIIATY